MKVLYILKNSLDKTGEEILDVHKKNCDVTVVKLSEKSADELLDLIEKHDKLIMW